jgi:hypothetical protein
MPRDEGQKVSTAQSAPYNRLHLRLPSHDLSKGTQRDASTTRFLRARASAATRSRKPLGRVRDAFLGRRLGAVAKHRSAPPRATTPAPWASFGRHGWRSRIRLAMCHRTRHRRRRRRTASALRPSSQLHFGTHRRSPSGGSLTQTSSKSHTTPGAHWHPPGGPLGSGSGQ